MEYIYITFVDESNTDTTPIIYHTEDIKDKDEMMIMFQKEIVYPYIKNSKKNLELNNVNIIEKTEENNNKLNIIYNENLDSLNIKD